MSAEQPTVVLVPGAWTAPEAYHKLRNALEAKAFTVHVPALPTNNGHRPPDSSFDDDVQAVRRLVQKLVKDDGKEVIMLMHSYGGVVGTTALQGLTRKDREAQGLPGGVVHLLYAAAFLLALNQNIRTVVQAVNLPRGSDGLVQFADDGTWFPTDPVSLLYHDLAPEDQEEQAGLLEWGNAAVLTGKMTYEAWRDVPTMYVRATEDRWLPPEFQDFCVKNAVDTGGYYTYGGASVGTLAVC
ncbi:prolyl aminopeptidase protein [Apiospora rasikravindrae]|uniref:Prolyl aminopeptidase protein n=1 Tax=Apiospora rasikravindrae TaxID=990691 RepID=A0ABR1RVY9_9PEZI